MDVVIGAILFFWTLGKELLMATLTSLEVGAMKMTTQANPNSTNDGDGTQPSIHSLKVMLDDLMQLEGFPFTNALPSFPLKSTSKKLKTKYSKAS